MDDSVKSYLAQKYNMADPSALDKQLIEAQRIAAAQRDAYNSGQIASGFGEALAGNMGQSNDFYKQRLQQSEQPVLDLQARQAAQMKAMDGNQQLMKMQQSQDESDPSSLKS